jgi:hypothetical protein
MRKIKSSFKGKIKRNTETRKRGNSYIIPPKGVDFYSPDVDTKINMDILPYEVTDKHHPDRNENDEIALEGSLWYKRPFKVHRDIGVNRETVICPASIGKSCPICEYRAKLRKEEDASEEEIKALRSSDRNLYAIIPLNSKKHEKKIHLFEFSDYLFQEEFEKQCSDFEEFEIFPDHTEGYSLRVVFAEESIGKNKYAAPTRFDFVERKEQYDDSILDEVPKLDDCLDILPYDLLKDKFFSAGDEPEDDDDYEDRTARKAIGADEEDEPEPEEEPVPEEEPRTPRRTRRAVKEEPKDECPYGHRFGTDNDRFDDCDDCEVWNECKEKSRERRRIRR